MWFVGILLIFWGGLWLGGGITTLFIFKKDKYERHATLRFVIVGCVVLLTGIILFVTSEDVRWIGLAALIAASLVMGVFMTLSVIYIPRLFKKLKRLM